MEVVAIDKVTAMVVVMTKVVRHAIDGWRTEWRCIGAEVVNGGDFHDCVDRVTHPPSSFVSCDLFFIFLDPPTLAVKGIWDRYLGSGRWTRKRRRKLEEDQNEEEEIVTTFSVVDNMREQFYNQQEKICRIQSVERPTLRNGKLRSGKEGDASSHEMVDDNISHPSEQVIETAVAGEKKKNEQPSAKTEEVLDPEAELAKLESEFGKINRNYSAEEIGDWEFDELEKELKSGDSATSK
ncbi:hypothetical protein HAX54_022298 [Datura stramonium]|uniref:Uncharacterized protein n=1 Tax=Datura stramonium TaxID=4076 RepID=A0ABS8S4U5_DATST|nr:hypothetical protein [Datura stramonium]